MLALTSTSPFAPTLALTLGRGVRCARDEGSWQAPDLGGLLHRVGMQDVTALLLSKARPALRAMHTLHHPASTPPARRRPAQATGAEWRGVGGGGGGGGGGRAARKGGRAERGESVQESALALQSELRAREYGRLLGPEVRCPLPSVVIRSFSRSSVATRSTSMSSAAM
eukprot:491717-Rhodomonas_salina.1